MNPTMIRIENGKELAHCQLPQGEETNLTGFRQQMRPFNVLIS